VLYRVEISWKVCANEEIPRAMARKCLDCDDTYQVACGERVCLPVREPHTVKITPHMHEMPVGLGILDTPQLPPVNLQEHIYDENKKLHIIFTFLFLQRIYEPPPKSSHWNTLRLPYSPIKI
jgi:hypothetical protein